MTLEASVKQNLLFIGLLAFIIYNTYMKSTETQFTVEFGNSV